jgi:FkbM family methyltransferase
MKYDFIEIGSSNFDTLLQNSTEHEIGLTVEPMIEYLNQLPNKPNITKVNVAIGDTPGELDIYYFSDENIKKYNLGHWFYGCNMIGKPHPLHFLEIHQKNLPYNIIESRKVPVITIETLFDKYNVTEINYLKIDTEGYDIKIMNMYINYIKNHPNAKSKKIKFESNRLSNQQEVKQIINDLITLGYTCIESGEDTILSL